MDLSNLNYNTETGEIKQKIDNEPLKVFMKHMIKLQMSCGLTLDESIDEIFKFIEKLS